MRLAGLVSLGLAAACVVSWIFFSPLKPPRQQTPTGPPVQAAEHPAFKGTATPGVHLLAGLGPSAAYLIESSQGLVLVDCGIEANCKELERQVASIGLDLGQLKAILLTHAHGDHTLGAAHLRARTGAKVYAGRGDCPVLRAGGPFESLFSLFPRNEMRGIKIPAIDVDVELIGGEVLDLDEVRIEAVATPGHTPGSMCYVLDRRDGPRVFFGGDTIVSFQQFGTYQLHAAPSYGGNAADFLASLEALQSIPPPDMLLPGHPDEFIRQDPTSALLTPREWRALLARGVLEIKRLLARQQADGADFLDDVPKQIVPGLYSLGQLRGRAVYYFSTASGQILFDAPGPGLVEFLRQRLPRVNLEFDEIAAVMLTSCDADAIAGLQELSEATHCAVVAVEGQLDPLKQACAAETKFLPAEDLGATEWTAVEAIPLAGRGRGPTAYRIESAGKTILVTGRLPLRLASQLPAPAVSEVIQELKRAFAAGDGAPAPYLQSLKTLASIRPQIWLPAAPLGGQSANLYGREWSDLIASNEKLAQSLLASPQP